ncbi:hypothetical protein B4N89_31355 [Embleya scabrispora]|uniref:Sialidase domain-containing protein n=1 Tax=Embleya scabrispora TaxID=159449 RepID=A0A1T3NPJ1_9ACTN|nr:hypothetical protein B4N89_31355 [Embleya scabrispora]
MPSDTVTSLWYVPYTSGAWGTAARIGSIPSAPYPALAGFPTQNALYCLHPDAGDASMRWTVYNGDVWSGDHGDDETPHHLYGSAVAAFGDRLYCVHSRPDDTGPLYCTSTAEGRRWTPDRQIASGTSGAVALTAGAEHLYAFHAPGSGLQEQHFDGTRWSDPTTVADGFSGFTPAAATYRGVPHCVVLAQDPNGDQSLLWTSLVGGRWATPTRIPGTTYDALPALGVSNDDRLVCVYCAYDGDNQLWWTEYDGAKWWDQPRKMNLTAHNSSATLAGYDGILYLVYNPLTG